MTENVKKELLHEGLLSIQASFENMFTYPTIDKVEICYCRVCGKISMLSDLGIIDIDTYFELIGKSANFFCQAKKRFKEVA